MCVHLLEVKNIVTREKHIIEKLLHKKKQQNENLQELGGWEISLFDKTKNKKERTKK